MKKIYLLLPLLAFASLSAENNVREDLAGALIFDPVFYLDMYPDIAANVRGDRNRFARQHWLEHGIREGRAGSPAYFGEYYKHRHPDIWDRFKNGRDPMRELALHWLEYGIDEGRASTPTFDVRFYLRNSSRLVREFGRNNFAEAVRYYNTVGVSERFPASPDFDPAAHLRENAELAERIGSRNYYEAVVDALRSYKFPSSQTEPARPSNVQRPETKPVTPEAKPEEESERELPAILRRRTR